MATVPVKVSLAQTSWPAGSAGRRGRPGGRMGPMHAGDRRHLGAHWGPGLILPVVKLHWVDSGAVYEVAVTPSFVSYGGTLCWGSALKNE